MVSIIYTKGVYEAKVTELEGHYSQLEMHLTRMEGLRGQMYSFWEDPVAQITGRALNQEIINVRNTMDDTQEMITFYKAAIDKLDAAGGVATGLIEEALGILSGGAL